MHLDNISSGTKKNVCAWLCLQWMLGWQMACQWVWAGDRVSCLAERGVLSGRAPASDMCNTVASELVLVPRPACGKGSQLICAGRSGMSWIRGVAGSSQILYSGEIIL